MAIDGGCISFIFPKTYLVFRMKEYAKMYDIVRHERNKLVNLVHAARQKTAEMKDRVKMLDNDMEILRNNAIIKDR